MNAPAAATTSAQVRSQLVTALELDLIGPTQRVLWGCPGFVDRLIGVTP